MQYIVSAKGMKEIDQYTIDQVKISSMVLMERAALAVVHHIIEKINKSDKILIVCGTGNNGGDGVAIARILHEKGYFVHILLLGDRQRATASLVEQIEIARNLDVYMNSNLNIREYNIIVDAIFGIGLSKSVTGVFETAINDINSANNLVFAVDIPSGVSADTGKIMNVAVKADYTITFGLNKLGIILYPGCNYAGKVFTMDIGFPKKAINFVNPKTFIYDKSDLGKLPNRNNYSNKGSFGKVLIVAGSKNMSGASFLSAKAAYRVGAGLVKVLTTEENRTIIQSTLPEAILSTYNSDFTKFETDKIINEIKWATVIVIGPGMGVSKVSEYLFDAVLKNANIPIIVDADALNLLAKKMDYNNRAIDKSNRDIDLPSNVIITPHLQEMARLLNQEVEVIANNLLDTALSSTLNKKYILALKDARTIVTDGDRIYINTSGNSGMAKAGSGDVLTGIIAGLIAQGLDQFESTTLGVYIHGLAADEYVSKNSKYSLIASDIIEALSRVLA